MSGRRLDFNGAGDVRGDGRAVPFNGQRNRDNEREMRGEENSQVRARASMIARIGPNEESENASGAGLAVSNVSVLNDVSVGTSGEAAAALNHEGPAVSVASLVVPTPSSVPNKRQHQRMSAIEVAMSAAESAHADKDFVQIMAESMTDESLVAMAGVGRFSFGSAKSKVVAKRVLSTYRMWREKRWEMMKHPSHEMTEEEMTYGQDRERYLNTIDSIGCFMFLKLKADATLKSARGGSVKDAVLNTARLLSRLPDIVKGVKYTAKGDIHGLCSAIMKLNAAYSVARKQKAMPTQPWMVKLFMTTNVGR
ncbi:hypothetical protein TrRE_jg6298, partial [Triparma retinervis]